MIEEPRARVALGAELKAQLKSTPLAKITVRGLAAGAGVNRQTFYYHFNDTHDLATWVFKTEIADHILSNASYAQWASGFLKLLNYLKTWQDQAFAVVQSLKHTELEHFFYKVLRQMMEAIVSELEGDLVLSSADRDFVIDHYTLCVLGRVLHWFATNMAGDPAILVNNMEKIMHGTVRQSLERFSTRRSWS